VGFRCLESLEKLDRIAEDTSAAIDLEIARSSEIGLISWFLNRRKEEKERERERGRRCRGITINSRGSYSLRWPGRVHKLFGKCITSAYDNRFANVIRVIFVWHIARFSANWTQNRRDTRDLLATSCILTARPSCILQTIDGCP